MTIAQKSHSFAETVIPATCTESGYTVGECRNCGMKRVYDVTSPQGTVTMYSNAAYDGTKDVYTARAVI